MGIFLSHTRTSNGYLPGGYAGDGYPLPSLWMGESWMVDGETSVMMVMKISSKSQSWQGARTEFLVPNRGFWWRRRNGSLSGKNVEPPLLLGQRVYVGGRRGRGNGRAALTTGGRGPALVAPPGGEPSSLSLFDSPSGSVGLLVK
jgi:hypothetical protein